MFRENQALGATTSSTCAASSQIVQKNVVSHQDLKRVNPRSHIYIRTRGVGSSDASRPSKARRPVLNLGTFLCGPFASCVLEGYKCQSPGDSSELPGYLDSSPLPEKNTIYSVVYIRFLSDPPRQTQTPLTLPSSPLARPCFRAQASHVNAEGSRGGCNKVYSTYRGDCRALPRSTPLMWPARHYSQWQPLRSATEGEDRREERRGDGDATKCTVRIVATIVHSQDRHHSCGRRAITVSGYRLGPRQRVKIEERRGERTGIQQSVQYGSWRLSCTPKIDATHAAGAPFPRQRVKIEERRGEERGRGCNKVYSTYRGDCRALPRSTPLMRPARHFRDRG